MYFQYVFYQKVFFYLTNLEIVIKRVRNANADDVILGYNFLLN